MSRTNPDRIYAARRAATSRLLANTHRLDEHDAEHWIARWEREAWTRGIGRMSAGFWQDAGA